MNGGVINSMTSENGCQFALNETGLCVDTQPTGTEACHGEFGTVEEGKGADLSAVRGDPLEDISPFGNLCLVVREEILFAGPNP